MVCWDYFVSGALSVIVFELIIGSLVLLVRYVLRRVREDGTTNSSEREGHGLLGVDDEESELTVELHTLSSGSIETAATASSASAASSTTSTSTSSNRQSSALRFEELKDSFVIEEADFQRVWQETTSQRVVELPKTSMLDEHEIEDKLAQARIYCKAAGLQNRLHKFYFYSQHTSTQALLLVEVVIDLTKYDRPLTATLKASDPLLLDGFAALLQANLNSLYGF